MNMLKLAVAVLAVVALGCEGGTSESTISAPSSTPVEVVDTEATKTNEPATPIEPGDVCDQGTVYQGFGGRVLVAGRTDEMQNVDRGRVKPYSALAGEYQRVLGKTPTLLGQMSTTFAQAPARWYEEPQSSAVSLYSTFRVGFVGCLELTSTGEAYAATPEVTSAQTVCQDLGRKFWSRAPNATELDACVKVAVQDTTKETNPRRRWAYTCASLLTAAGFITY